ncbi:MAG TPA: CARDB domain-containing protein [Solirubrobacterales bacterium]|nr:CARDB domain-containing protein [Solirubrobacterales bacterium]
MLRRALALGGGLILVILIVLGVKGCLDARANRELSDYARNVTQIVEETQHTSQAFFGKLEDPGTLSVTEFVAEVNADRSAMDNYASRVDGLSAPGDMGNAQQSLELVYELRAGGMSEIAEKMSTALGDAGAEKAMAGIAHQMQKLLAADVLYENVTRPDIDNVLASNGISGSDVPKSTFLPDETKWLDEGEVSGALSGISGSSGAATPGVHGLGLIGVGVNGSELAEGTTTPVAAEGAVEVEVQVQNQGESTENGVSVSVSVEGNTVKAEIDEIPAGEIATASIPLTPAPSGEVALEIEVEPVAGEQVTENNEATYSVLIE